MGHIIFIFIAFALSLTLNYIFSLYGCRWGFCDKPSRRRIHTGHVSRLGGAGFILSSMPLSFMFTDVLFEYTLFTLGMALVFIEGLLDDLLDLHFSQKMTFEFFAASFIFLSGLGIRTIGFGIELHPAISFVFTVFAAVGVINAMNMIDGADGVSGTISLIALLTFAYLFYWSGHSVFYMFSLLLAASILGFLIFNFPPARIFMGDNGSLTLGYIFTALSIFLTQEQGSRIWPIIPVLILSIPIFDTLWVIYRRFRYIYGSYRTLKGTLRNIHMLFYSDNRHLHHLLLRRLSPRAMILVILLLQLFFSIEAVLLSRLPEIYGWVVALLNFILVGNLHKLWKEKEFSYTASEKQESRS